MEDFANILHRDYGLKPQGKSTPMSAAKSGYGGVGASSFPFFSSSSDLPSSSGNSSNAVHRTSSQDILNEGLDNDQFFGGNAMKSSSKMGNYASKPSDMINGTSVPAFVDVFGGLPKFDPSPQASSTQSFDDASKPSPNSSNKVYSQTRWNAPLYDDDVFGGVQNAEHDNIFSVESNSARLGTRTFDDLLGGFGSSQPGKSATNTQHDAPLATDSLFDELLPGFGGASLAKPQPRNEEKPFSHINTSMEVGLEDPFTDLGLGHVASSTSILSEDPFRVPDPTSYEDGINDSSNGYGSNFSGLENKLRANPGTSHIPDHHHLMRDTGRNADSPLGFNEASQLKEGSNSRGTYGNNSSIKQHTKTPSSITKPELDTVTSNVEFGPATSLFERFSPVNGAEASSANSQSQRSEALWESASDLNHQKVEPSIPETSNVKDGDEFWITIEDVKLLTQPTYASPPSRPPPAPRANKKRYSSGQADSDRDNRQDSFSTLGHSSTQQQNAGSGFGPTIGAGFSSSDKLIDELREFASGGCGLHKDLKGGKMPPSPTEEDQMDGSAAATASGAAMKEAIERAEAKLRQAKEAKDKERGESRSASFREESEKLQEAQEEFKRQAELARDEREREEREGEAKERWRIEREKEKEREREKNRIAVEKANEARERAAVERATAEARERAAEKAAERAAVDRAATESRARVRVERAAVERATAEARERAAAEARGKAAKMAAERAASELREREAAAQRNENDLEAFFMASPRPASAPKQRTQTADSSSADNQQSSKGFSSRSQWRSANTSTAETPSASSMADDLASIFGGPTTTDFQEVEGESRDRRNARLDRYKKTLDRAAKALEEKQRRDLLSEKEQAERHRAADLVDSEIKRWAAGKEGNLRALLSTLHYVLWPECGWQPVSLTELITAAAVKKVYRKATLYVHPDKVQQKGATIQQKYIAEKIFDLLKEAWNKFNSEELF